MTSALNLEHIPFETSTPTYSDWHFEELELRGFLIASNRGMHSWFQSQYSAAENQADKIFDPDLHDESLAYDLFSKDTGIDPNTYWWQLSAAVIKDACALFEVFLERSAHQVLRVHGAGLKKMGTENSWQTHECDAFYKRYLNLSSRPSPIRDIIWMRNKLTHLRAELRTPAGMADFEGKLKKLGITAAPTDEELALGLVGHEPYVVRGVHLTQVQTWRILNVLREHINSLGVALHGYEYGAGTSAALEAVGNGQPVPTKGFDYNVLLDWTSSMP